MQGVSVTIGRSWELQREGYRVFHSPSTGFWVLVDDVPEEVVRDVICLIGDEVEEIPDDVVEV